MEDKKIILVIEDEEMLSSMYKTKLEQDGYKVIVAQDGLEGLNYAKNNKVDLIALDIIMPQIDGFTVLEELKKDKRCKDVPVVMLTNLGTEEDIKKGKNLGAIDYLVKAELTPAEISSKISTFFKK